MSAISSPARQSLPMRDANLPTPVPATEIDESCRGPVMLLFVSAAVWALISSVFGMIATLKFHDPNLLADNPFLTYGRVHPAALNALAYGFGMQAGLGAMLWMLAHLGRTRLAVAPAAILGWLLWNLGVTVGFLGILGGDSTGFQWLEFPQYAAALLFLGYLMLALSGMVTFHERRERPLTSPLWFMLAAMFWFPWIYSTAEFLLVGHPVRGALQMEIDSWYVNNLKNVWFGFVGLAAIFYFIPKLIERPLYSHYIGIFVFWTMTLFGSWAAVPPGAPLPAWLQATSSMGALLTVVPVIAVAINVFRTKAENCSKIGECRPLKFFLFGTAAYVLAGLAGGVMLLEQVSRVVNFTWFIPAQAQLLLYGFFAITMFGAIYHIVPRLLQTEFPSPKLIGGHFLIAALGILAYALPLAIGGVQQGGALNNASKPFPEVMLSTLTFLRISTLGDTLIALGHLVLLLNLLGILVRAGRTGFSVAWAANSKNAGVKA